MDIDNAPVIGQSEDELIVIRPMIRETIALGRTKGRPDMDLFGEFFTRMLREGRRLRSTRWKDVFHMTGTRTLRDRGVITRWSRTLRESRRQFPFEWGRISTLFQEEFESMKEEKDDSIELVEIKHHIKELEDLAWNYAKITEQVEQSNSNMDQRIKELMR